MITCARSATTIHYIVLCVNDYVDETSPYIKCSVPVGMAMTGVERMLMSGVERDKQRQRKLEARRKYRDKWCVWVIV